MTAPPIITTWDGEGFHPVNQFQAKLADKHYVIGERYAIVEHHDRSMVTHNHQFAAISEIWKNLPEHLAERFPTSEHVRKFALIKTGYHDSQTYSCASKAEALRLAAAIRPLDEFSVVVVEERTVTRYTAQSQSMRAMGAKAFQQSKTAVLDYLSEMIGTDRASVEKNARTAA